MKKKVKEKVRREGIMVEEDVQREQKCKESLSGKKSLGGERMRKRRV